MTHGDRQAARTAAPPARWSPSPSARTAPSIGSFSNGTKQAVGQIALANFTNPGGLEKAGRLVVPGHRQLRRRHPRRGRAGRHREPWLAGSLEMSNVDLSQEFTNLIVAQRGFQANARIITTSDRCCRS